MNLHYLEKYDIIKLDNPERGIANLAHELKGVYRRRNSYGKQESGNWDKRAARSRKGWEEEGHWGIRTQSCRRVRTGHDHFFCGTDWGGGPQAVGRLLPSSAEQPP